MDNIIQKALQYATELEGIPYKYWYHGIESEAPLSEAPIWASNEKSPDIDTIRSNGMNCSGMG